MDLTSYRPLGRSGLVVSPLALGTMTFGTQRWGTDAAASQQIFDRYVDAGGNLIDSADVYANGHSEELVGRCIAQRQLRDRIVLSTKFTWNRDPGNPHGGGNGRKHVLRAVEQSLARLQTDYIDLYWLHFWDMVTPVDEVLETMSTLVRAGKIRYYGLSNVPAWYATKLAVLAAERGMPGPVALQLEYSLVERSVEYEFTAAAREMGMGLMPWSPLAGGLLSGKYSRSRGADASAGRLDGANPFGQSKFTERNWTIMEGVEQLARSLDRPMSQVALAWLMRKRGVDCVLVGVRAPTQLEENVAALALALTPEAMRQLDALSAPIAVFPYSAFNAEIQRSIFGNTSVDAAWRG